MGRKERNSEKIANYPTPTHKVTVTQHVFDDDVMCLWYTYAFSLQTVSNFY
jgi:hypothetical protein